MNKKAFEKLQTAVNVDNNKKNPKDFKRIISEDNAGARPSKLSDKIKSAPPNENGDFDQSP